MAALTSAISATTSADNATLTCSGEVTVVITPDGLAQGEVITLKGEDPAGTYTDPIFTFTAQTPASVNIRTHREVYVDKTATSASVGVGVGGDVTVS